jgi:hypothetical protein
MAIYQKDCHRGLAVLGGAPPRSLLHIAGRSQFCNKATLMSHLPDESRARISVFKGLFLRQGTIPFFCLAYSIQLLVDSFLFLNQ